MNTPRLFADVCRWTARVMGTLFVLLILIIAIGEGMPILGFGQLALYLMMIGILVGWRWELTGGIISLAGLCLFCLLIELTVNYAPRGMTLVFFFTMTLPGALYVTSALLRHYHERHISA